MSHDIIPISRLHYWELRRYRAVLIVNGYGV